MAYLDISQGYDIGAIVAGKTMVDADKATLSPLEWSVVALAQKDRLSSLNKPGRVAVAMGKLFGSRPNPALADTRLEALRRIAVLAWHRGYAIASNEIRAFKAAGFTIGHYELVLASISRSRNALNQRVRP